MAENLKNFSHGASRAFWAGNLGAPVDIAESALNLLLAAGGTAGNELGLLKEPPELLNNSVGGSEWIASKMRRFGLLDDAQGSASDTAGSIVGGLLSPIGYAKSPQIAGGLLQAAENAAAPSRLSKQAGMIRIPGRGQIPETRSDVDKLSTRLAGLLDDAGVNYTADKSNISPARYFQFNDPSTPKADIAEYGYNPLKVRISDHVNKHGADLSVDPHTNMTFEEMLSALREKGIPLANRAKPKSKAVVPDDVLEKILGKPLHEFSQEFVNNYRNRLVLDKKGYWTEKR
jgi:hypothetical protein